MLRKLGIEPGEGRVFAWAAVTLVLIGWADVSVKNVAETLFMKRVGPELLPWAFLVSSVLLVATTYVFGLIAARRDRLKLLPLVLVGIGLLLLPLWLLVRSDLTSVFVLLLIASKQLQSIALLVFWIAMGDLLNGRQAKRLFAPMMAGVTLGTIAGSFASEPLGRLLGIETLLPLATGVLCCAALVALPLRRLRPPRLEHLPGGVTAMPSSPEGEGKEATRIGALFRESRLFRLLFVATLCSGLLGPMLYFQFSYVANQATTGEEGLLSFYSQFRGWISVGVLVAQLLLTSRIYRRIGIPLATALSPLVYLVGFFGLSVRLNLPVGVGAMAGTKLQDNAVYDPALRILYSLFPERLRSRASAVLEGPVKRSGGALGNVVIIVALAVGSATSVGGTALPIAALWLATSLLLWRQYPVLLLQESSRRISAGDAMEVEELLDPNTLRSLAPELASGDVARCQAVIELVSDAEPRLAVDAFASAARDAPATTRPLLLAALDRVLEKTVVTPFTSEQAASDLETLLADPSALEESERADLVQAYGRLAAEGEHIWAVLAQPLTDSAPAVRLAALAAVSRSGDSVVASADLDTALRAAIAGEDAIARRTAREEFRSILLAATPNAEWGERLGVLATLLDRSSDRAEAAESLAEVARQHGAYAGAAGDAVLAHRDDPDPRVRAALLRFCGYAGLEGQARWLVEHLGSNDPREVEAAGEGLRAFEPVPVDVLLVELSYGKRRTRNGILSVMRDLTIEEATLRELYERELEGIQRTLVYLYALTGRMDLAILVQRLEERVDEGLHTAMLFLAAIHDEDRIGELGEQLRRERGGRRHAILLEALESLLSPREKMHLVPMLEDRNLELKGRAAAAALRIAVPDVATATQSLADGDDEITSVLARELQRHAGAPGAGMASPANVEENAQVLSPVEIIVHLKSLPIFERLTTRQLMDLAGVVQEETHPGGAVVVREGEYDDCLYLIVEGAVQVTKGDTVLNELNEKSFFGEMAVFEGTARSATVVAKQHVRLLRLERSELLRLMEDLPAIAISVCQTLSRRVRELTDRVRV